MDSILSQALGQDVSKLAAEEKQRLLSRLLAHLAHEIRNPLSSLDIHVQLLSEDLERTSPELRQHVSGRLEIIRGELHRLENVVRHYIGLAGPSAFELRPTRLAPLLDHVGRLLRPEAESRDIQLLVRIAPDLPDVAADAPKLTQALLNLVINALQAVERHGNVEVAAERHPSTRAILVSVTDDGPGIPEGRRSAIFEPFYSTKSEGGGLGLWIAQQIVLGHHAALRVGPSRGRGAQFTLEFPAPPEGDAVGQSAH